MRRIRWVYGVAGLGLMMAGALAEQACGGAGIPIVYTGVPDAGQTGTGDGGKTGSEGGVLKNPDGSLYTVPFDAGNGMACIGPVGGFPPASCDPSDETNSGCTPYGTNNGCPIAAKCGDPTTCEPFTKNPPPDAPDGGVDTFRMRLINITAPPALAKPVIQSQIVTAAVDLPPDGGCGESGSGLFNWLISVDKAKGTITTGGAPPSPDPWGKGYCFINGTVTGVPVQPTVSPATFVGNTFSTPPFVGELRIPIFLAPKGEVILPIRGGSFHEVALSPDGNCIGAMNQASLTPPNCTDPSPTGTNSCSHWHSAGTLGGYITLEEADGVYVQLLGESLCVLLTGDNNMATSGEQKCSAAGKTAGDYCAPTTDGGTGHPCANGDSFWLSAQFAASAVKLGDSQAICDGGTLSPDASN